jgi:hypothetical protein
MTTTYTDSLKLALQGFNDNVNTWGTVLNDQLQTIDAAIAGIASVNITGSVTVDFTASAADGSENLSDQAILKFVGLPTANCSVTTPAVSKWYIVQSSLQTSAYHIHVHPTGSNVGVTISASDKALIFCDGTDMFLITRYVDMSEIPTSASVSAMIAAQLSAGDYTTSTEVSTMISAAIAAGGFITSASVSSMVSAIGSVRDWISSASVSVMVSTIIHNTTNNQLLIGGRARVQLEGLTSLSVLYTFGNIASIAAISAGEVNSGYGGFRISFVSAYSSVNAYTVLFTLYQNQAIVSENRSCVIASLATSGCMIHTESANIDAIITLVGQP